MEIVKIVQDGIELEWKNKADLGADGKVLLTQLPEIDTFPTGGTNGQVLKSDGNGGVIWGADNDSVLSVNGEKGNVLVNYMLGKDTRDVNSTPEDYLKGGPLFKGETVSQIEFKFTDAIQIPDTMMSGRYCLLNTINPWTDRSGGFPIQVAYGYGVMAIRFGYHETTWNKWKVVPTLDSIADLVTKSDLATKQDKLVAGNNITISEDGKTISAKDTTYGVATTTANGLMSNADKVKLDGVETGAQKNTVASIQGKTGAVTITKADVGLGSVENIGIKILTQTQYDVLSPTEKNRTDILYAISG